MSVTIEPTSYHFDFLVFIGRFQPFHKGHEKVVETALEQARHVIILIGSSRQPRSIRNPWKFNEREQQIRQSFAKPLQDRLIILPLMDDLYNDQAWVTRVQQSVNGVVSQFPPRIGSDTPTIGLIGHPKDRTSYYLALFPQWQFVSVPSYQNLSSTPIRERYFLKGEIKADSLPEAVTAYLQQFQTTQAYQEVVAEWQFLQDYQRGWECAPYPPVFVTVDTVVVQSGHVLLVERRARPGAGLKALPGGFIQTQERLKDAAIRELREETRIKIPVPVLTGSISREQVFDAPNRSTRGRTITHAYLIELKPDASGLPKVKGRDDAKHACWIPLGELDPEQLFEDHFYIIKTLVG